MRKSIYILSINLFIALHAQTATAPAVGDGSSGNPYRIDSLENLYCSERNLQKKFILHQNFSNTINPSTKIKVGLPKNNIVDFRICRILGLKTASQINKEILTGYHLIEFGNNWLASGIYIYRLRIDGNKECFSSVKKMIYLK